MSPSESSKGINTFDINCVDKSLESLFITKKSKINIHIAEMNITKKFQKQSFLRPLLKSPVFQKVPFSE